LIIMKKIFTKIIAIMSAACMLPMTSALADTTDSVFTLDTNVKYTADNWEIQKFITGYTKEKYLTQCETNGVTPLTAIPDYNYAEVAYGQGITGNALALNWEDDVVDNVSMRFKQAVTLEEAGDYRISFWVKGKSKGLTNGFIWDGYNSGCHSNTNGEWKEFTYDKTIEEAGTKSFQFILQNVTNMLVDNITVYKLTTDDNGETVVGTTNLITNGDFENVTAERRTSPIANDIRAYEWDWQFNGEVPETSYITIDNAYGRTDNSCIYMFADYPYVDKRNITLYSKFVKLTNGNTYEISLWMKTSSTGYGNIHVSMDGLYNNQISNYTVAETKSGWQKRTYEFTATKDSYSRLKFINWANSNIYLDDITLVDTSNKNVNLIGNSSFAEYEKVPVSVVGDKTANNWTVGYGSGNNNPNKEEYLAKCGKTIFAEPSAKEAKSGDFSMLMSYPDARADNSSVSITTPISVPAGEYTLAFYAKGSYSLGGMQAICRDTSGFADKIFMNNTQNTSGITYKDTSYDGEWKKYQFNVSADGDRNGITILADNLVDYIYIDDVSLVDANGKEYITNGGFEDVTNINISEIENLMAYPIVKGEAANISWVNPKNDNISLKLYVNGVEDTNFVGKNYATSQGFNEYLLTGLTNWQNYKIKLELTINDKVTSYETSVIPRPGAMRLKNWETSRHDGIVSEVQNYANITADVVRDEGYESSSSLLINSNRNGVTNHTYFTIMQNATIDTTKVYEFSYKAKIDNARDKESLYLILDDKADNLIWKHLYNDIAIVSVSEADENGWVTYTYALDAAEYEELYNSYEGTLEMSFRIAIANWADSINLDDITLYELDPNNGYVPVGENLITDGGFEIPDSIVNEPTINYYDTELATWVNGIDVTWGAGKYSAQVIAQNISEDAPMSLTILLAGYKDGKLLKVVPAVGYVPLNQWAATTITAEGEFEEVDAIKAMVWEGNSWSMIPVTSANTVQKPIN